MAQRRRPNVLMIMADQLTPFALGAYGLVLLKSPMLATLLVALLLAFLAGFVAVLYLRVRRLRKAAADPGETLAARPQTQSR